MRSCPSMPASRRKDSLPTSTSRPSTVARTPRPVTDSKASAGAQRQAAVLGLGHHGGGEGVLGATLGGGGEGQGLVDLVARHHAHRADARPAGRERARLVEDHGVDATGRLERGAATDEHARVGRPTGAHHHRGRRGQAHGARAGDDEHADGRHERVRQGRLRSEDPPDHEGDRCQHQHQGHEPLGDAVGHALDGGLGALGLADHAHDLAEHRVAADVRRTHHERAVAVDGGADDLVAGGTDDRQWLAGEHRLIHARVAARDHAVHGHLLTRSHPHEVTGPDVLEGHVRLELAPHEAGGAGAEADQGRDRSAGAGLGAGLHPAAGEDQADDHGRGVEVGHRLDAGLGHERGGDRDGRAVAPGRERAQRHQRVHRDRAVASLAQRRPQEDPAGPELDERRRDEQQPVELRHRQAQQVWPQHEGHDRERHDDRHQRAEAQVAHLARAQVRIGIGVVEGQGPGRGALAPDARRSRPPRWLPRPRPVPPRPDRPARWPVRWRG